MDQGDDKVLMKIKEFMLNNWHWVLIGILMSAVFFGVISAL